jgi:hypothetical protein
MGVQVNDARKFVRHLPDRARRQEESASVCTTAKVDTFGNMLVAPLNAATAAAISA